MLLETGLELRWGSLLAELVSGLVEDGFAGVY